MTTTTTTETAMASTTNKKKKFTKSTKEFNGVGETEGEWNILNAWSNNRTDHVQDKGHAVVWEWPVVKNTHTHTYQAILSVHFIFHLKTIQLDHCHTNRWSKRFSDDFHFAYFYPPCNTHFSYRWKYKHSHKLQ